MKVNFRHGIISHQEGTFLQVNGTSGDVDLLALNRPTTLTNAHKTRNYTHSENNTVTSAWLGPFLSTEDYWLYWDFDLLTFQRTFGYTLLEPVAQSAEPGGGDAEIIAAVAGGAGVGSFTVPGKFVLPPGRIFAVINSTSNDGMYAVSSTNFDTLLGNTTIIVQSTVPSSTADGELTLDIDSNNIPLRTTGRMWYDTASGTHYELTVSNTWREVLRVFAAQLTNGNTFLPQSINSGQFTGTQIGDVTKVFSGRVLFDEDSDPIKRDDGTFLTTEDQFFTALSRVDGLRLESNVARGQSSEVSSLAGFTPVAWSGEGQIRVAQYNDVATTVTGIVTEDLLFKEVGQVIIQGVVENIDWSWTTGAGAVPVGTKLWIENGDLVSTDPHVSDPITYPTARVPVARVLDNNTVVYEQGLGGVGPRGPQGDITNLPAATTTSLGGVTLVTPSSDAQLALVISDTDPRLADARIPLPHLHDCLDVSFTPAAGITSNNVCGALEQLGNGKLNRAGDTMTGFLTLSADPVNNLHAATKTYVDNLVQGLVWLDPICVLNMIDDTLTTPPGVPVFNDSYIVPLGATGAWSAFTAGDVVTWDGGSWINRGPIGDLQSPSTTSRVGIAFSTSTVPGGSFAGLKNQIAIYNSSGTLTGFEIPTNNNAVFVCGDSDLNAFSQWAYTTSGTAHWVLFGGGIAVTGDDVTTVQIGATLQVKQFGDGGINDVKFWQGLEPSDLDTLYIGIGDSIAATTISVIPYSTSLDWGTVSVIDSDNLLSTNAQSAFEEMFDKKASKTPHYTTEANFPTAANVPGMLVVAGDVNNPYFANGGVWNEVAVNDGSAQDHDHVMPYDITFFIAGPGANIADRLMGSYIATRALTITGTAPNLLGYARLAPTFTFAYDVQVNGVSVAAITWTMGTNVLTQTSLDALDIVLAPGDRLEIFAPATPESFINDVSISLTACGNMGTCPVAP